MTLLNCDWNNMRRFIEFLNKPSRNTWISEAGYDAYYRKSFRTNIPGNDGSSQACLDLANIKAHTNHIGKKCFPIFLTALEKETKKAGYQVIFIENILNKQFGKHLVEKQGFAFVKGNVDTVDPFAGGECCLYKRI